jgi:hypothetical protein
MSAHNIDSDEVDLLNVKEMVDTCLDDLLEVQVLVEEAAQAAVSNPSTRNDEALEVAMERRREFARDSGMAILQWLIQGGRVEFKSKVKVISLPDIVDLIGDLNESEPDPVEPVAIVEPDPVEPELADLVADLDESPAPPPKKPKPAASKEQLAGLLAGFGQGTSRVLDNLRVVVDSIGEPATSKNSSEFNSAVAKLNAASERTEEWLQFDLDTQRALTGLLISRARHLQDVDAPQLNHPLTVQYLNKTFSNVTSYSRINRPGFVIGLSRQHDPEHGSWLADGIAWWNELRRRAGLSDQIDDLPDEPTMNPEKTLQALEVLLDGETPNREEVCNAALDCLTSGIKTDDIRLMKFLHPWPKLLTKEPRLKSVRKCLRNHDQAMKADGSEALSDTTEISDDWPYWSHTRGKVAQIIGADPRPRIQGRIKKTFQFGELGWEAGWNVRRVESIGTQIANGNIDLVIFLARWMSHSAWHLIVPICKEAGIPFVLVEGGYGVSQIRATMEKVLPEPDEGGE